MVVTVGQQYNVEEKPTVILYTYIVIYRKLLLLLLPSLEKNVLTSIQHLTCSFFLFKAKKRISVVTICNNRSPELLVKKYCIPSLILFLVFVLVSLHGD